MLLKWYILVETIPDSSKMVLSTETVIEETECVIEETIDTDWKYPNVINDSNIVITNEGGQMYKIAICEDDKKYIETIKKIILATSVIDANMLHFEEFLSGEQLLFHPNLDFDMIVMDIQMGKTDGYETAMELRKRDNNFLLVFCSGVVMPTPKFFKANAFRYLDKTDSDEVLIEEMTAVMKEVAVRKDRPFIMCKCGQGKDQIRVFPESVLYATIRYTGCQVFTYGKLKEMYPTEILRTNIDLNSIEEIFNEEQGFVRIHKSFLVNMAYIMKTSTESIELIDGTILNVARSRMKGFKEKFVKYAAAKYEG